MINLKALIVLLLLATNLYSNTLKKSFTISYDPDYAPFSYLENNVPEGLLIDFWELWAEKNNYKIEFVNGKFWNNSISLVKNGKVDFFLGTEAYDDWMVGSQTLFKRRTSFFIHKETSKDFVKDASYIIGIVGDDYKEEIIDNFPNSQVIVYKGYDLSVKDLISKKIDLLYDDKIAIEFYTLQKRLFHQVKPISLFSKLTNIQAISKSKELIELFNEGLNNLNKEELQDIEEKWIINNNVNKKRKKELVLTQKEKDFIKNKKINVAVSQEWKPFSYKSASNTPTGISTEIFQLISKDLNLNLNYTFFDDFTKQLDSIKNKKQDIIFSTGKTKDREEYSIFTSSYISFPISIVTLKDENFIENIEQIKDKKIAVGENFTAHKLLKEKYPYLNFLLVKNIKAGLTAVENKKAFAYIDIKPNLDYNISKLGLNDLKISGNTNLKFKLRMMIRDDYIHLQTALNKAIENLDTKKVNEILTKWENIQFEDTFNYKLLWIILFIIFCFVILLIYLNQLSIKQNKFLKEKVDERTKELKILNETLEKKVQDKTKKLKRANYLLDEAQKIAHLGSFQYDIQEDILFFSYELFKIFELDSNNITPSIEKFLFHVHDDDKEFIKNHFDKKIYNKNKLINEFRIITNNRTIKYLQITSKLDKNKQSNYIVGTILDITKIKKLELEKREKETILAQQSKMAAMGEMLENIAHQWRQPLSVISTISTGMQITLEMENKISKELMIENSKSINEHAQYLSRTIDDFRNFFNPNKESNYFNIDSCIDKALYLVMSKIKSLDIEIIKNIENININTYESELIQVLINIFNNSIDALAQEKLEKKYILITVEKSQSNVIIDIRDNANGVPENIKNRVFEPYFTTKHKFQGTGVGLYMSSQIVTKHLKGSIQLENKEIIIDDKKYKGASFKIIFPINDEK